MNNPVYSTAAASVFIGRLFGNASPSGTTGFTDYGTFISTYGSSAGTATYINAFDLDNSGTIRLY